jgi:mediator of RNA polymerase II transcription subunit 5
MKRNMKPIEQWRKLLHGCVASRIEAENFRKLVKILFRRAPLPQASLVEVLLDSHSITADIFPYDPLIPRYATALRKLGLIRTSTFLDGVRKRSVIGPTTSATTTDHDKPADQKRAVKSSTLMTDTRIVQDVITSLSSTSLSLSAHELHSIFTVAAEWILAVVRWHASNISDDHQSGGLLSSSDALALFESLGILLFALSTTEKGLEALSSESTQGIYNKSNSMSTTRATQLDSNPWHRV